ncbi:hypothetical protein D3C77_774600 [compost metagenome]
MTGEQPITGSPQSLTVRATEALLQLQLWLRVAGQPQLDQRLGIKAEAQPIFGFIGYKTTA